MIEVGIRELKRHVSEILRRVRDHNETITVTNRGRPIARILPAVEAGSYSSTASAVWSEMEELALEVCAAWPPDASAQAAVGEQRREL